MKIDMLILFFVGSFFTLVTLGGLVKAVSGRWFDDEYVFNFVKNGYIAFFRIAGALIALTFIYCVFSLIQNP